MMASVARVHAGRSRTIAFILRSPSLAFHFTFVFHLFIMIVSPPCFFEAGRPFDLGSFLLLSLPRARPTA
eukprot:CCRYP_009105-RA/>CCRYP_009105-RA protein AED:0.00 eAED:0.00 QI:68/1/1/1/0/0/2/190/69